VAAEREEAKGAASATGATLWEPALDATARHWQSVARRLTVEAFAPRAAAVDAEQRYPVENVALLAESGIDRLFLPEPYGGGGSLSAFCAVIEAIAEGCASTSGIVATLQLGANPVVLAGSEAQKAAFLSDGSGGLKSIAFALSEREAGSDPAAMTTTAAREGGAWRLRGEKCWIGGGSVAETYVVFAQTRPGSGHRGIAAFLVHADQPGVAAPEREDKMGMRGTVNARLVFDTLVEDQALLAEPGAAFRLALEALKIGRISVAAQSCGIALAAYRAAARHAASRRTFGRPIIDHQGIGFRLADVSARLSAGRMMTYAAAAAYDAGADITVPGAQAKLFCSEMAHEAVDVGVQVFGGAGFVKPNLVERLYRDQRATEIYEGTSEIQRLVIARAIKAEHELAEAAGSLEVGVAAK
jgi:alkylation response protein AidB-like acyl-CoA dehydrogenase